MFCGAFGTVLRVMCFDRGRHNNALLLSSTTINDARCLRLLIFPKTWLITSGVRLPLLAYTVASSPPIGRHQERNGRSHSMYRMPQVALEVRHPTANLFPMCHQSTFVYVPPFSTRGKTTSTKPQSCDRPSTCCDGINTGQGGADNDSSRFRPL